MTPSDFDSLTRNGDLCNKDGALEFVGFERVMREQVLARNQPKILNAFNLRMQNH
jgi:hypothetical protein